MTNFDDMKLAVQALSGGKNTVILDDLGMPSIMVIVPQMKSSELIEGATETIHPAFIIDGTNKAAVAVSKYQNIVVSNRAYSLPMQDPRASITVDVARSACRTKGDYWTLMPFSLWSAIALWTKKNGTMPHGNNNYGSDVTYAHEKGVQTYQDNGKTGRCATGSGPTTWYHDYTPAGIADMNGNVSEWCDGMRLVKGEIQIIPYANCALPTSDNSATSSEWRAINSAGNLINPGATGSLKYDWANGKVTLATTITTQEDASHNTLFQNLATATGLSVPQIIKELALFPADADGYEGDNFYINNGADERFPYRGGSWTHSANAGVFYTALSSPRSYSNTNLGFRSAFYGEL